MLFKIRPNKILYTIPNFDTAGSGKALLKIADRLDQNRFEPHICCLHDRGDFFNVVEQSGVPVHIYPYTTPMIPRLTGLRNCWRISRFFKEHNFDLIHSFHYDADYSEALAARMVGIKWVYTKKNMNWGGSSKNGWRLRSRLANGIIAQNTDMLNQFFSGWQNVKLIPRGVDTVEFAPDAETRERMRRTMRLTPSHRLVVCVANLVPVKGVEVLIRAFVRLAPKFPDACLTIIGDDRTDYARSLKEEVRQAELESRIRFTGKVLNVRDHLNAADMFVLPTLDKDRREGSPVSLLEAIALGKLVLASRVAGIKDQLSNFRNLLFEPGSVVQLTHMLEYWLAQPQQAFRKLGNQLRREVRTRFTIDREVKEHEAFYLEALSIA